LGLALIAALVRAQRRGKAVTYRALAAELGIPRAAVDEHLRPLADAGFVARTQAGLWVLIRSPEAATLQDLYAALRLPVAGDWCEHVTAPWEREVAVAMERVAATERAALAVKIAALIGDASEPAPGRRLWRSAPAGAENVHSPQQQRST